LEVAAFVSPKVMPHMADAEEVIASIPRNREAKCYALVLNLHGVERAVKIREKTGLLDGLTMLIGTTDRMVKAVGIGETVREYMGKLKEMIRTARNAGMGTTPFVSGAFGCSIEGAVSESRVLDLAKEMMEAQPTGLVISDSTGQATPLQVHRLFTKVKEEFSGVPIIAHFHDTRGAGLANVLALLEVGIKLLTVDASFGGLGGDVPFLPEAAGNISTEDLISMLDGMGIRTGVDLKKIIECSKMVEKVYAPHLVPSRVVRTGPVWWRKAPV
jgi:isopropylmalate/homocitrate/citramalate synthase